MIHSPSSRRSFRFSRGYTLLEIMLVLGIIALLLGAAVKLMMGNLEEAREQRVDADVQSIKTQLKVYEMQNFNMPSTAQGLEALVKKPTSEPLPKRWRPLLESVPLDPWGMPYQYANPGKRNPGGVDIYSWGPDRKESEDDMPSKN